jgi:peptidoglycan/LPS O-acetylase OafA/YrhL
MLDALKGQETADSTSNAGRPSQNAAPRTSHFYRPELDGLRFIAFLAVFVSHAFPRDWAVYFAAGLPRRVSYVASRGVAAGGNGVPLFFVLSSYLITTLLLRERERFGRIRLRDFYVRRALRIWPLYFAFIIGVCLLAPAGERIQAAALPAHLVFLANWNFLLPAASASAGVAGVLWSVSVEEQFYALWPLALRRLGAGGVGLAACLMIGAGWVVRAVLSAAGASEAALWLNTFAWLDAVGAGALLALLFYRRLPRLANAARLCIVLAGAAAWVAAACLYAVGLPYAVAFLGNTGGAVLMLWGTLGGRLLASRPLVFLGRISYGLYVFHAAALAVSDALFRGTAPRAAAGLALTVGAAVASYYVLELPFLRLKERFTHVSSRPPERETFTLKKSPPDVIPSTVQPTQLN